LGKPAGVLVLVLLHKKDGGPGAAQLGLAGPRAAVMYLPAAPNPALALLRCEPEESWIPREKLLRK